MTYTTVVTAQNTLLADEEAALQILESRLTAKVSLICALRGGWTDKLLAHVDHNGNPSGAAESPARPTD